MDDPKSGFPRIRKFPIDILAGIVFFVPGEDIGRLKMTGCKSFWSILTCPNVVKSVNLGEGGIRFKSWPSFMNEFPSLESLRIESFNGQWWSELSLTLDQLPSTLRHLSILRRNIDRSHGWSCDRFFEIPTRSDTIRLDERLPHLEVLLIWDNQVTNFDWVSHCPPTLTRLEVHTWKHDVALPSSLIHFKAVGELPPELPLSLESLICPHYSCLLPSLTSLSASLGNSMMANLEDVVSLPPSLTNLTVYNILPSMAWPSLSANLQSLSFSANAVMCTVLSRMADPTSGEILEVQTCPLELLPKSLTKLHIASMYSPDFFVPGSCSSLFPPQLKSLDAQGLTLAPNAAKQLPSSLTYLSTSKFYEQLCEHLPQGLTSLSFKNALLSPKTIQCLPKSLTNLNSELLHSEPGQEEWFDYTTGKPVPFSSLPEYSVHKDYPSYFACLSPKITSVELSNFGELQDDFIQNHNFSNLLSLTLVGMVQLSDHCIPHLNRHLTRLDVNPSPNITGKCFKSLPRSLTYLRLGTSSAIFDEDIQHLPRTLQEILIPHATELSEACIRDFPRSWKRLNISQNTNITRLCIPIFPVSMASFIVANWRWVYGKEM